MQCDFSGVLKILGVNERFGLDRVLAYPLRSFILVIYLLIIKDICIFTKNVNQQLCESAISKD
jgi:hypothetical protein